MENSINLDNETSTETTATITALSHDGRGIAKDAQGKTIFIDGALPNESVAYTLRRKHRRYNDAKATRILKASPDRQTAKCDHFLECGGCALQHLQASAQLASKQAAWLEQLLHFGQVEPENILPPLTGPQYHYRHKARLGVRYVSKKQKVVIGFRERFNSFITDCHACEILPQRVSDLILPLATLIECLSVFKEIPQIEVACGTEGIAFVIRHLAPLLKDDEQKCIEFAKANQVDIYLQPKGLDSIWKLYPAHTAERLYYQLPAFDLTFGFHPTDFTQVNPEMNQRMIQQALALLSPKPDEQILDLYCGIGNFTLPVAKHCKHVVGVEGSDIAVSRAKDNAKDNQIANVDFYAYDLAKDCSESPWAKQDYQKVLLDPPRSGAEAQLPLLIRKGIRTIVYVSCNPATFARDCGVLVKAGYRLKQAGIMDMFPQTMHVESIALLEKD